jgi:hypothetical protein
MVVTLAMEEVMDGEEAMVAAVVAEMEVEVVVETEEVVEGEF